MLFSSPEFLFGFLPATIVTTLLASYFLGKPATVAVLIAASMFFYAWWSPSFLILLIGSVVVNYTIGRSLTHHPSRLRLSAGIAFNLGLLGYFKYVNFFLGTLNALGGTHMAVAQVALPLGISFFTFQKIAFLVDAHRGRVRHLDPLSFFLFVFFFPQLISGPIVHHSEFIPQLREKTRITVRFDDFWIGLAILSVGLAKKVVIADSLATYADPVFASNYGPRALLDAWGAVLCFTLQIYFDFSGYSDMAIGLARIFGIKLPLNFDSPYKAHNIIEFWRSWHMTLSRFLRDYVYIPLGGNRHGRARRYANLMLTMLLGGLWHGASWTFVFWGGYHGALLIVNHGWRVALRATGRDPDRPSVPGRVLGVLVTFLAVEVGWVFFRAADWNIATSILSAMVGANGLAASQNAAFADANIFIWLAILLATVWFAPNTQQWLAQFEPALSVPRRTADTREGYLAPFLSFITVGGVFAVLVMVTRTGASPFIYFVF
jgi:alginate O-acetyltransferase complex protein AlgI